MSMLVGDWQSILDSLFYLTTINRIIMANVEEGCMVRHPSLDGCDLDKNLPTMANVEEGCMIGHPSLDGCDLDINLLKTLILQPCIEPK